jgi:molybdate transport system substrate-binding protein
MPRKLAAAALTALVGLGLAVSGCSSPAAVNGTVTVYAAASMQPTFDALKTTFEAKYPGTKVTFNYAGSQALATQLKEGASADVFVSANDAQMKVVTDAGLASGESKVFATNQLTIAVPPDNPASITSFQDLTKPGLKLVVCQDTVPCGAATKKIETATGITLKPVSQEDAVTKVMVKVRTGEADAGLVYKTDVIAAGDAVKGIEFAESSKAINSNSIVLLKNAPNSAAGQAWVTLITSAEGQKVLTDAGFGVAK